MTLSALIFDVDGTLAETEEAHRRAFNETFAEAGLDWHWSIEDYRRLVRTTGGKERMLRHREEVGSDNPSTDDIARLHRLKTVRYGEIIASGGVSLRPGIRRLVAEARANGLKLAIATTTNRPNVDVLCQACWSLPAGEVFHVIAAGDEVESKKPSPDVYDLALKRLGLPAGKTLAFEDSRNGLMSALAAGISTVVTPSIYTNHEAFAGAIWTRDSLKGITLSKIQEIASRKTQAPIS